nr:CBS domain protein [uncultured bacterium]
MDFQTTIGEIMTKELISVFLDDKVDDFKEHFERRDIHHILVEDRGRALMGIISTEDMKRAYRFMNVVPTLTARHIMTDHPTTLRDDMLLIDAVILFLENKFRALPVLNEDRKLVGIVTTFDLMQEMLKGYKLEKELEDEEDFV